MNFDENTKKALLKFSDTCMTLAILAVLIATYLFFTGQNIALIPSQYQCSSATPIDHSIVCVPKGENFSTTCDASTLPLAALPASDSSNQKPI